MCICTCDSFTIQCYALGSQCCIKWAKHMCRAKCVHKLRVLLHTGCWQACGKQLKVGAQFVMVNVLFVTIAAIGFSQLQVQHLL